MCHGIYILASCDTIFVCTVSKRELGKFSLEVIVAADCTIGSNDKKFLIF